MASRELFKEMIEIKPRTDLERAVFFYYKLSCSFGGLSRSFALRGGSNIIPLFNKDKVEKASKRLANVVIDNLSFEKLITKYDRKFTFFYVDPPYYEKEKLYDRDSVDAFTQHKELRELLGKVKGKWLLSYNDHPKVRELYKGYDIQEAETLYSLSGKTIPKTEILIKNY